MTLGGHGHGISLLSGWLPIAVQLLAGVIVLAGIGQRSRLWLVWCLPASALIGAGCVLVAQRYISDNGLAGDPAPPGLWVWLAVSGASVAVALTGWPGLSWRRRGLSVLAVPLTLLCTGLMLNDWVGYFPTLSEAYGQLTAGALPDETDGAQLSSLAGSGPTMRTGRLVAVDIPAARSHFTHREEYVYLPPAWFDPDRPALPALLMVAGEFNTPADWIRAGGAVHTVDEFALAHHGVAPVLVFVDSGGSFNNDTECVDGPRGHVASYLSADVPSYLEQRFRVPRSPASWGVVGWSAGGTCAVDLAVMHPELFGTFEDIAGDLGPNVGNRAKTIATLYGGDATAWTRFDPVTVLAAHSRYPDSAGWFVNSTGNGGYRAGPRPGGAGGGAHPGRRGRPGAGSDLAGYGGRPDGGESPAAEVDAATTLCAAASARGIQCTQHVLSGRHSWQFASSAFGQALPWLAQRLGAIATGGAAEGATAAVSAMPAR